MGPVQLDERELKDTRAKAAREVLTFRHRGVRHDPSDPMAILAGSGLSQIDFEEEGRQNIEMVRRAQVALENSEKTDSETVLIDQDSGRMPEQRTSGQIKPVYFR